MRDRLVELIRQSSYELTSRCVGECGECADKIADYLLANGVVVPLYRIGQTVYVVDRGLGVYWQGTVTSLYCEWNTIVYGIMFNDGDYSEYDEECVFLTKEEAERALKGGAE